jgi:hypothetical protein
VIKTRNSFIRSFSLHNLAIEICLLSLSIDRQDFRFVQGGGERKAEPERAMRVNQIPLDSSGLECHTKDGSFLTSLSASHDIWKD